jgi:hypothetical protein
VGLGRMCYLDQNKLHRPVSESPIKVKIKLFLCLTKLYTMKAYVGVDIYIYIYIYVYIRAFIVLGTIWNGVASFTPLPLYLQGKSSRFEDSWFYQDSTSDPSVTLALASQYTECINEESRLKGK